MEDNSRYSNWRRRDQAYREDQERKKELRLNKEIAKEAFEWETLTAAKEKISGNSSHKTLILEAYKIALKDAVGRSQCDKVFEIFSFGSLALIHEPALSSFVLIESYINPIVNTGPGEHGWAKFEVSEGVDYFQYGDGFSELSTIELALLDAMIAYLNQGGALSREFQGTRSSSGSSILTLLEIYN